MGFEPGRGTIQGSLLVDEDAVQRRVGQQDRGQDAAASAAEVGYDSGLTEIVCRRDGVLFVDGRFREDSVEDGLRIWFEGPPRLRVVAGDCIVDTASASGPDAFVEVGPRVSDEVGPEDDAGPGGPLDVTAQQLSQVGRVRRSSIDCCSTKPKAASARRSRYKADRDPVPVRVEQALRRSSQPVERVG